MTLLLLLLLLLLMRVVNITLRGARRVVPGVLGRPPSRGRQQCQAARHGGLEG